MGQNKVELVVAIEDTEYRRMLKAELVDFRMDGTKNPASVEVTFDAEKSARAFHKEIAAKLREIADEIEGVDRRTTLTVCVQCGKFLNVFSITVHGLDFCSSACADKHDKTR